MPVLLDHDDAVQESFISERDSDNERGKGRFLASLLQAISE
jgi:hypothetical protein